MNQRTQSIKIMDYWLNAYDAFLLAKSSPIHRVDGHTITFETFDTSAPGIGLELHESLFDYQRFIVSVALKKRKFAVFADVGLGKTLCFLEWIRHVSKQIYPKKVLIISQLHLIRQTLDEQMKFYGWTNLTDINRQYDGSIERFLAAKNRKTEGVPIGIVNIDKFRAAYRLQDAVGAVVLDESSCLKNETGKIRSNIIKSCKGIGWKLACTATPAPNDRMEYANHALFLDYIDNYKQFFTKFFYNTGSGNDFLLKPHARKAFYGFLAAWSIFLKNPAHYGFGDNLAGLQPPDVVWDYIILTSQQRSMMHKFTDNGQMNMFRPNIGGITNRTKASQIAKGFIYGNAD
jgi:hypothetical protein